MVFCCLPWRPGAPSGTMRRAGIYGFVLLVLAGGLRAQQGGFSGQLSPEDRHRAGLDNLTPEERSALDELVAKYGKALATNLVVEPSARACGDLVPPGVVGSARTVP